MYVSQKEESIKKEEKKSFNKLFIFLGIGILVIVGVIILLILLIKGNKKGDKKDKKEIKYNPGYFIPEDEELLIQNCQKCFLENCEKCNGTKVYNECISCNNKYFPIYEKDNIKFCEPKCEIGNDDQCGFCNHETNKCEGCNPCFIFSEGKCLPNYSLKETYNTNEINSQKKLIYYKYLPNIIEMSVDDIKVSPTEYYTFDYP